MNNIDKHEKDDIENKMGIMTGYVLAMEALFSIFKASGYDPLLMDQIRKNIDIIDKYRGEDKVEEKHSTDIGKLSTDMHLKPNYIKEYHPPTSVNGKDVDEIVNNFLNKFSSKK